MQHFLAGVEAVFARGFREGGQGAQGRAARAGLHQLGPVHGHAVLPVGTRAFVARDLRRPGMLRGAVEASGGAGGTQEVYVGLEIDVLLVLVDFGGSESRLKVDNNG